MKTLVTKLSELVPRFLLATVLLCLFAFCLFGFLDSFEPGAGVIWKLGYGILGCACLLGTFRLLVWQGSKG